MYEPAIHLTRLDRITRLLADTKKTISYDKGSGLWNWVDRGSEDNSADYHCGFKSWLEAAEDAVSPYMD